MKEKHLFTFNQFRLFSTAARACVQLSVRREGGERRPRCQERLGNTFVTSGAGAGRREGGSQHQG